jgi:acyl carrier protein
MIEPLNQTLSEIKALILKVSNLPQTSAADIGDEDPLFAGGLGLDSIDALELAVELDKRYGIKVKNDATGRQVLNTPLTMAHAVLATKSVPVG